MRPSSIASFSRLLTGASLLLALGGCVGVAEDDRDPCSSDEDCALIFGGGSVCNDGGFCTEADPCTDDADCEASLGAGWVCESDVCVDTGAGGTVFVTEDIADDTVWTRENTYVLQNVIFVNNDVTLTIESGTTILGEQAAALVVETGGRLDARGTPEQPIVFTSSQPVGMRNTGDWAGVAMLGRAPTNENGRELEGVDNPLRSTFGGSDAEYTCGVLEYVRIEFAGFAIRTDEELNGLTLGGCGRGTIVSHVQVHYGKDDGVEVFGGTVNLDHIVITRAQDDSLDWDSGWTGTAQYVAIQQDVEGDAAYEAANNGDDDNAMPRANPTIYNATLVGASNLVGGNRAMILKEGTAGTMVNHLMLGHGRESIDIRDEATVGLLMSGDLEVRNSMFFSAGASGTNYFPLPEDEMGEEDDDDGGFDENMWFTDEMRATELNLTYGTDPGIADAFNLTGPTWVPAPVVNTGAATPPTPFDEAANFIGAFQPGTEAWTSGWTAYPAN
jgi:hypothetical protein